MDASSLLPAVLGSIASSLPQLLALFVALIIAMTRWNKWPTVSMYVAAGAGVMLITTLISRVAFTVLPITWNQSGISAADMSLRFTAMSLVTGVVNAIGLGLWIAAAYAQREPSRER